MSPVTFNSLDAEIIERVEAIEVGPERRSAQLRFHGTRRFETCRR